MHHTRLHALYNIHDINTQPLPDNATEWYAPTTMQVHLILSIPVTAMWVCICVYIQSTMYLYYACMCVVCEIRNRDKEPWILLPLGNEFTSYDALEKVVLWAP